MPDKEQIRPIYSELQGYLAEAPTTAWIECAMWVQVNVAIGELSKISGEDYNRFKMVPEKTGDTRREILDYRTYRTNLGGLIARLHARYFTDEQAPFRGMPSTVITQTQHQNQSMHVQMLLDIQSKIDEKLHDLKPGDKKRTFLEKMKGALGSARDYASLLSLCLITAKEVGLTLEELSGLFK